MGFWALGLRISVSASIDNLVSVLQSAQLEGGQPVGDLITYFIAQYGWTAIVIGVAAYFIIEMTLDVAGDLISEAIRDYLDKRAGRTPR